MKLNIHPAYGEINVVCRGCDSEYIMCSTITQDRLLIDNCSNCHPFYTGKQKVVETGGRVQRFYERYKNQKLDQDEKEQSDDQV